MDIVAFNPRESKKNTSSFRRENSFWSELALIDLDRGRDVVNVRFYGSGATVYCVAWFSLWQYEFPGAGLCGATASCRGMGKAGGYGYHKPSAAMSEAFQDAGIVLSNDISGVGDTAMLDAMLALAAHVGIARPMVFKSHP